MINDKLFEKEGPIFMGSNKTNIDPSIGPIQGVHPKANAMPIRTGLKKFLFISVCTLFS